MSAEVKVIHMGRRAGKTTQALKLLSEKGGGIFITRHPLQALAIANQHGFEGIDILPCTQDLNIVVDDADELGDLILSSNRPVTLDYVKTPQVKVVNAPILDDAYDLEAPC